MAFWNFGRSKTNITGFAEQDNTGQWISYFNQYFSSLGNSKILRFKNCNAYELACNLAEIFIPIDAIADRAASVPYELVNARTGELYEPSNNLKRLILQPNPIDRFSDIIYKAVFSELSDGNSYVYTKTPESIKNPTIDNISNVWVLQPNLTKAIIKKEIINPFLMKSESDYIKEYQTFFLIKHVIEPRYIVHRTATGIKANGIASSPLISVERNIDNVLAVYHARYNVYAKNGSGGILSKDASSANNSLQEAVDPVTRDTILKDLQDRNGLIGNKNFIGLSSIPLRFIKTLGTISELQPFEETESNAVAIAGIYGVDPELIPKRGSSTFTNKNQAEKALWQNVVKPICVDKARDMTAAFYLPEGIIFRPNFSNVEVLQEDKKTKLESDLLLIDNLIKLGGQGIDVTNELNNIKDHYNEQ